MMKFRVKNLAIVFAMALALLIVLSGCGGKAPEAPAGATARQESGSVLVAWNGVEGADRYRLFRSAAGAEERFLCDTANTEYADSDVEAGETYTYTVHALSDFGMSPGSSPASVSLPAVPAAEGSAKQPVQITSATAMDEYTTVLLLSEAEEPCQILRSDREDGVYLPIGITADGAFYDTDAGTDSVYYYRARRAGEVDSRLSPWVMTDTNPGTVVHLPVFMYQEFVTEADLAGGVAFDEYAVYSEEFEQDLKWLAENGYTTVTTAQVAAWLEGSGSLPEKPVMLTIDDGKLGVYKRAWPLLQQYGMTAVLAVIGYRIEQASQAPGVRASSEAPYCTWEEIGEMSASGAMEIISHTYDLHIFNHDGRHGASTGEGETAEQYLPIAQKDFARISRKIREVTGSAAAAMAYPYSKRTAESDRAWLQSGYKLLLAGDSGNVSRSRVNHILYEAGPNTTASVLRRITRMTGTGVQSFLADFD